MSKIRSIIESALLVEYRDAKNGYFIRCCDKSEDEELRYFNGNNNIYEWTPSILDCTLFDDKRKARRALAECLNERRWSDAGGPGGWLGDAEDVYEELIKNNDTATHDIGGYFEFSIGYINVD